MNPLSLAEKRGIIFVKQKRIARSVRWFSIRKIFQNLTNTQHLSVFKLVLEKIQKLLLTEIDCHDIINER